MGISMILGAAEGEIVPESADVQRAALQVLCYLLCGPIIRPGCVKNSTTPTPRSKLKSGFRTSDEVINKVWECVRFSVAMKILRRIFGRALMDLLYRGMAT